MLFISQPQSYFAQAPSMVSMPMNCSIDDYVEQLQIQHQRELQRERQRANLQQEYERNVIAKLNEPSVEKLQDAKNYYIILNKRVSNQTYQYINKFSDNYQLKQMDDQFIVRSLADNYYNTFKLPSDTDLDSDITYQVRNKGYQLKVSIPKKIKQRTVPVIQYMIRPSNELLLKSAPSYYNNSCLAKKEIAMAPCAPLSSSIDLVNGLRSDVEQGVQSVQEAHTRARAQGYSTGKNEKAGNTKGKKDQRRQPKSATIVYHTNSDVDERRLQHNDNNTSSGSETEEVKTQTQSKRKLGPSSVNYETTKRKTTFAPNEMGFDDEEARSSDSESIPSADDSDFEATVSHPVKKIRSPTVEDLIDEEFA